MISQKNRITKGPSSAKDFDELLKKKYNLSNIKSRFKKRYLLQNIIFSIIDLLVFPLTLFRAKNSAESAPQRVLISNGGRLGDQIITARLIFALKKKYPDVLFDILTQSGNGDLHKSLKVFSNFIFLDHWYFSRNHQILSLIKYYSETIWRTVSIIKKKKYDLAIDLRYSYPNSALPIFLSRIPHTVGYKRVGLAPFYTKSLLHTYTGENEFNYQKSVLEKAGFEFGEESPKGFILNHLSESVEPLFKKRYVVLHPCGSIETKNVPLSIWTSVVKYINSYGYLCVVTGAGDRDEEIAQELLLLSGNQEIISLVNNKSLSQLIELVAGAQLVISVETFMGHLGAALGKPVVSLAGGFNDFMQWMPYGNNVSIITNPIDCSPCFRYKGCSHNQCIKGISEENVLDRLEYFFINQASQQDVQDS